ncbi:MAG: patatin-like phospholipase family protein, partial [Clostridia bacterium]
MKIGLCLAGGGIKGAAHIGAIKALEEENIRFDYVSGTSSGSIVATLYAVCYCAEDMYKLFKKYSKKIKYVDFKNILKTIWGLITERKIINGLNSGVQIEKIINGECNLRNIQNIKDIKMPILIPSVDLNTGNIYIFSSINFRNKISDNIFYINDIEIGKAIRESCIYPGVFSPCNYKDIELIDGGIRENVPWKETKKIGADKVISIIFEKEINKKCHNNIIDVISNSIDIFI